MAKKKTTAKKASGKKTTKKSTQKKKSTKSKKKTASKKASKKSIEKEIQQKQEENTLMSYEEFKDALDKTDYVAEDDLAMCLFIASKLGKPILIEGPPGTGKTELAKIAAEILDRNLIRVQCYEGIDESQLIYEWQYSKQLLFASVFKDKKNDFGEKNNTKNDELSFVSQFREQLFTEDFLLKRPITQAILSEKPQVLLIDEIDRADQEIEAMLLEVLSDNQVSIPEIGTLKGVSNPLVILTSNNTRRLSEALRRRCIFYYTKLPSYELELKIIYKKFPGISKKIAESVCKVVQEVRNFKNMEKIPNTAETIDWLKMLLLLNAKSITPEVMKLSMGVLLKNKHDIVHHKDEIENLL